jgi:hypothetical protein
MHAWRCFTRASGFCPAGSLAWASYRAGLAGSSPTHMGWAGPSPSKKIYACIKKINLFYWFIHLCKSRE